MTNFLHFLLFIGNVGFACLILLPFSQLTFNEWLSASIIVAHFQTKSIIDKEELHNKIFELKQLLEDKK